MIKVVEVTYWPAETFIVRHLQAVGDIPEVELSVFVLNKQPKSSASIDENPTLKSRVVSIKNFRFSSRLMALPSLMRQPFYIWSDVSILRYFEQLKPDLIFFPFGWNATGFIHHLSKIGCPYAIGFQGSDIQIQPLISERYKDSLSQLLSRAARIHTVCDKLGEKVRALFPVHAPIQTIRTCLLIPPEPAEPARENNQIRFISTGRLNWVKGFHDLIRAMSFIPEAQLDIVGSGEEHTHLTYLIHSLGLADRIRILNKMPYSELESLLINATAYVQTSLSEGFSNSLAEAMALGKPVFATPAGGTAEIVKDLENGVLLPTGDPQGIAQKLRLVHDNNLMHKLGSAARITAQHEFSYQRHAEQFADFFAKAVHGSS